MSEALGLTTEVAGQLDDLLLGASDAADEAFLISAAVRFLRHVMGEVSQLDVGEGRVWLLDCADVALDAETGQQRV